MASSNIQQNQIPNEPTLKDLLDLVKKEIMLSLTCHHIGTIQSFDTEKQTAVATINYKKTYFQRNVATQNYDPVLIDYPIIIDCPVICLGGGLGALTFPVVQGDECLILFNDRDIDNWFNGNTGTAVATSRLHSISDAIILVGVRSMANVLEDYDDENVVLKNDLSSLTLGEKATMTDSIAVIAADTGLVEISNDLWDLKDLLVELITNIQTLVTATSTITVTNVTPSPNISDVSGFPANAAAIVAVGTSLALTSVKIQALLK